MYLVPAYEMYTDGLDGTANKYGDISNVPWGAKNVCNRRYQPDDKKKKRAPKYTGRDPFSPSGMNQDIIWTPNPSNRQRTNIEKHI